jgi:hypothetical protein
MEGNGGEVAAQRGRLAAGGELRREACKEREKGV